MIRIAQVGTFDVDNLGDLLFPVVFGRLVAELAEELDTLIECTFFSPQGLAAGQLYRDQPGSLALEHLDRIDTDSPFDLIFIGGGDIIRDDDASLASIYGPNASSMAFSHLSSPIKAAETRLVLLMPGVPFPLSPSFEIFLENSFRRLRFAAVRDRFSAERLSGLVPADIRLEVLPDIVGAIAHFYSRAQLLALETPLVAPDLRRTGYICFQTQPAWCADVDSTGQVLRQLEHKTGLPVVLIEIGKCLGDDRFLSQLAERFSFALARPPDATGPGTLMQKVAVIAASRGFVGSSLHGVILAHAYGVPHFCFSGAALSKVRGFYETCATGRYYSDFAECFGQLDAISECLSRAVKRVSDEAAVASKSSDYERVKHFVRKAIASVTGQRPRRSSDFTQHVDLQYRRFQTEQRQLEEQIADLHRAVVQRDGRFAGLDHAAAERDVRSLATQNGLSGSAPSPFHALSTRYPRLRVALRRTIKFAWWSITFQLFEKYRERRERLAAQTHIRPPRNDHALAVPFPWVPLVADSALSVAVICHMFFDEMAEEFKGYLSNIPFQFDLCITTNTTEKKQNIESTFNGWKRGKVEVRLSENRGRDIAPKLITCADIYSKYEYVLHIHSKHSPHWAQLAGWRKYLLETLLGSSEIVLSVFQIFRNLPNIGMIAPQHLESVRPAIGWRLNYKNAETFSHRLALKLDMDGDIDFPSGSMFWARSAALMPILSIGLSFDDFPIEKGQTDGTLAHVIERLYFHICESAGYDWIKVAKPDLLRDTRQRAIDVKTPEELSKFFVTHQVRLLTEGHNAGRGPQRVHLA
jgi:polysaccharide pyruvyl transferase WcaK-like protein